MTDADIRLHVYEQALAGAIPSPGQVAAHFQTTPVTIAHAFRRLAAADALVLLPDSPYIWMAEPFSAVPTDYPVEHADGRRWHGNCIWDAMAIAALAGGRCRIETTCPGSGARLEVTLNAPDMETGDGVVHFAVPANRWWESIGFT